MRPQAETVRYRIKGKETEHVAQNKNILSPLEKKQQNFLDQTETSQQYASGKEERQSKMGSEAII